MRYHITHLPAIRHHTIPCVFTSHISMLYYITHLHLIPHHISPYVTTARISMRYHTSPCVTTYLHVTTYHRVLPYESLRHHVSTGVTTCLHVLLNESTSYNTSPRPGTSLHVSSRIATYSPVPPKTHPACFSIVLVAIGLSLMRRII